MRIDNLARAVLVFLFCTSLHCMFDNIKLSDEDLDIAEEWIKEQKHKTTRSSRLCVTAAASTALASIYFFKEGERKKSGVCGAVSASCLLLLKYRYFPKQNEYKKLDHRIKIYRRQRLQSKL